ncbi:MAG TPA: hypothetical protein VL728_17760 [Cyclobacteriaceae bacterium]|nr:hypothetical protein [Cyclobacteriaceae bacterium]
MDIKSMKEVMKGVLAVVIGVTLVFTPYSLLIGWNLITFVLFWFIMVPLIAFFLPPKVSRNETHLIESVVGVLIFYALMVFMIYDHYESDFFFVMMISCVVNLIVMFLASWTRRRADTV